MYGVAARRLNVKTSHTTLRGQKSTLKDMLGLWAAERLRRLWLTIALIRNRRQLRLEHFLSIMSLLQIP